MQSQYCLIKRRVGVRTGVCKCLRGPEHLKDSQKLPNEERELPGFSYSAGAQVKRSHFAILGKRIELQVEVRIAFDSWVAKNIPREGGCQCYEPGLLQVDCQELNSPLAQVGVSISSRSNSISCPRACTTLSRI